MFRRIKTIVFALLGVAAIATTTAFSVWRYDYVTDQTEMNSANGIDDIKENYSFGAEKPQYKQYTIYLFPSSAYGDPMVLNSYMDTMGITNKKKRDHYLVHPEELFGVLTPVLDDNNLPIYGPDRSIKTKKQVFNKSQNKWVDTKETAGTYDDDYIKATLALDDKEANGGTSWKTTYLDDSASSKSIDSTPFTPNEFNEIKNKSKFRDQVYSCKNYEQVKALVSQTSSNGLVDGPYQKDWRFQGRLPKREQRFGYWSKIKEGEGQYLPEKLVINGSISPTLFKDITFKPFTSMGDANTWYNFTFSNWSYDSSLNAGTPYKPGIKNRCLSLDAFSVNDLDSVFDVSKNLSMFSDTNGVIRLYPSFSNGKNYDARNNDPKYGGRDAIKLNYKFNPLVEKYAEKNQIPLPIETYFSYSTDSKPNGSSINNGLESMFYATAHNITLMDGLYDSLTISTARAKGSTAWPNAWYDDFAFSNSTLVNNIINIYGQGAYNIYAFIGNSAHEDIKNLSYDFWNIKYYLEESKWTDATKRWLNKPIDANISTKATDTTIGFEKLKNKNIYDMKDDNNKCSKFIDEKISIDVWFSDHYETRTYQHRPIHICFEKIADYSLYKDLNFRDATDTKEVIDGKPVYTSTTEWPEIEQEIKNKKPSSQSLVNASNLYFGTGDTKADFKPDANNSKIDDLTAYAYYIKNVDFTDSFNSFFQIRASEEYIDLNFNENPGDPKKYPDANKYAGKNVAFMSPVTPENPKSEALDVYLPGYNNPFIDYVKIRTKNKDGVFEERNMFKLKSEEDKGIYDFVFIKYKNTNNFFMYIHRHRNIFVKVLTERVGQYKEEILGPDNKGTGEYTVYAEHRPDKLSPTNEQIWESDFYIGEALKTNKQDKTQVTFEQRILDYMNKKNVTSASLVDHVTGLPVCFFTKEADGTIKTHTKTSQSRDAPILKILKNYILYITPGIYVSEQAIQV